MVYLYALHDSLTRDDCTPEDIRAVLRSAPDEETVRKMLSARNKKQMTPLMVAATSGGGFRSSSVGRWVAVARELLAAGAGVTAAAGSNARLTAADYAAASGKPRLSAELRELEAAARREASRYQVAAQPGCTIPQLRCHLCGDRLGESKFRQAEAAVSRGEVENTLIRAFFAGRAYNPEAAQQRLDVLCHPLLHAVNRRDAFTREFTEALAMLARLEALVAPGTSGAVGALRSISTWKETFCHAATDE